MHRCARASDPIGKRAVRHHHGQIVGSSVGLDEPDDFVIGRVGCGLWRVCNLDRL
jgi:hypothetical protein